MTFTRDVAPIVFENCSGCHRPGEVAPFALLSYKDLKKRASQIADVVSRRYMPPWKPVEGHGDFVGERRLSEPQVRVIEEWVKQGAPEGDPTLLPPAPKYPDGWTLGEPDLVVKMPAPFKVNAEGRDQFRMFVIPLDLPEDKYVTALDFRPGNHKVVHHALFFLDGLRQGRELDGKDGQPGWGRGGGLGFIPTGGLGGWAPGVSPKFLPEGYGRPMKKGADLVLQMHFHPSGKEEIEQSTVGLYFAKKPPEKITFSFPHASRRGALDIAAGDNHYVVDDSFPVRSPVDLIGVFPHAHLICREVKIDAQFPDGTEKPLIFINDWDWDWQDMYLYKEPIHIPAGTIVKLHYVFDNSSENVHNPSSPPKRVRWGEQTTDEMAFAFFQIQVSRQQEGLLSTLRNRLSNRPQN